MEIDLPWLAHTQEGLHLSEEKGGVDWAGREDGGIN